MKGKEYGKCCNKVGLSLGIFVALMHAAWALMVFLGVGQTYLDFIFPLHMIKNAFIVISFDWLSTILLIIITFICGYVLGYVFTLIYNLVSTKVK